MKKLFALLSALITVSLLSVPFFSLALVDQTTAINYLLTKNPSAWSVMAQSALGRTNINVDFLKNISGSEAIHFTAPILAITSAGKDPKTFPNFNAVEKLKSFYNNGQLGDPNSLNDDIFGILALLSSGENKSSEIVSACKTFVLQNQNQDGSWGFALGSGDTDMTAAGIVALKAAGVPVSDPGMQKAILYLKQNQTNEGGFLSSPTFDQTANSASTAWAIWAFNALGIDPSSISKNGNNPFTFLNAAQHSSGYISYVPNSPEDAFTPNITSHAVIAASGKTLPIKILQQASQEFQFRIEGSDKTICQGHAPGPSTLDVIKNASVSCGYSYVIEDTQYGPYLKQIGNDGASGLTGWQYAVNSEAPSVGAADYQLKAGDSVLWYFGSWDDKITKITLSDETVSKNQSATATVEYKSANGWLPLEGAKIAGLTSAASTNFSGQAVLSYNEGYYQVFAEKPGFVRSNTVSLKVGEPTNSSATLTATIGQVNGETDPLEESPSGASFTVDTNSINFGNLSKGQAVEKSLKLSNNGSVDLNINSLVEGDDLFKDNLHINNSPWKNFSTLLKTGQGQNLNAKLSIPQSYSKSGSKTGQITFWAQGQ